MLGTSNPPHYGEACGVMPTLLNTLAAASRSALANAANSSGVLGSAMSVEVFIESLHLRRVEGLGEFRVQPLHDWSRSFGRRKQAEIALQARIAAFFPEARQFRHELGAFGAHGHQRFDRS